MTTFESNESGPTAAAGCLSAVDWGGSEESPWEAVAAAGNNAKYFDEQFTASGPFLSVRMRSAPEGPSAPRSPAFIALRAAYADDWPPEGRTRIGGGGDTSREEHEESMQPATVNGCLNLGLSASPLHGSTAVPPSPLAVAPAASAEAAASSNTNNNSWVVAGLWKSNA